MAMATSPQMEKVMEDVDLMKLAKVSRLRVEDFTDEQCFEVLDWLEGKTAAPSVVTDYLAPLKRGDYCTDGSCATCRTGEPCH